MSLNAEQRQLVKEIAEKTVDEVMDKFTAELKEEIIPNVVKETLSHMGADVSDLHALQADFIHLRKQREQAAQIKSYGIKALVTLIVTALGTLIWAALRNGGGS